MKLGLQVDGATLLSLVNSSQQFAAIPVSTQQLQQLVECCSCCHMLL